MHLHHRHALRLLFQKAISQPIQNILEAQFRWHKLRQIGAGIHLSEVDGYTEWADKARRLAETGEAILKDEDGYGPWLDTIAAGKPRAKLTVDQLRNRIEEGHVQEQKAEERRPRREPAPRQEEGIAYILDDPGKLAELRKQREERERKEGKQQRKGRHWSMRM